MADPADIQRLIGDLAREGEVVSVDLDAGTARVGFDDDFVTGDIPWLCGRAGATRIYAPPSVGEQVLVLAPEADTARGIIIGSLSSNAHPHPARDARTLIDFADDALISYDPVAHVLTAALPPGAKVELIASGGFTLKGPLKVEGPVTVEGDIASTRTITAETDVVGAGKSLKGHVHTKVQAGTGVSGAPQ